MCQGNVTGHRLVWLTGFLTASHRWEQLQRGNCLPVCIPGGVCTAASPDTSSTETLHCRESPAQRFLNVLMQPEDSWTSCTSLLQQRGSTDTSPHVEGPAASPTAPGFHTHLGKTIQDHQVQPGASWMPGCVPRGRLPLGILVSQCSGRQWALSASLCLPDPAQLLSPALCSCPAGSTALLIPDPALQRPAKHTPDITPGPSTRPREQLWAISPRKSLSLMPLQPQWGRAPPGAAASPARGALSRRHEALQPKCPLQG